MDGTTPRFAPNAKRQAIESQELTVYYDAQCPYFYQSIELTKQECETNGVPVTFVFVDTLEKAKALPCVFNNFAVFYKGKLETVKLIDTTALKRILKK